MTDCVCHEINSRNCPVHQNAHELTKSYEVKMTMSSPWIVGYHPEKDEIFIYRIDQDDLCWVYWRNGLDACHFYEFMKLDSAIILGDL